MNTTSLSEPDAAQQRTVRWALALFAAFVLLQRLSVPGLTNVSLLLPLALGWSALGLVRGVVEFDPQRTAAWIAAASTTALVAPLQLTFDKAPMISNMSWALLLVQFFPATLRFRDRRQETVNTALRGMARICCWLAGLSVLFMASQLVVPYSDWVATVLPKSVILEGFNTSYPVSYGSAIYKSNAWICLEASFLSYVMAVGILAALMTGMSVWVVLWLLVGLFSSASGSGFAILVVGILVMLVTGRGQTLKRFAWPAVIALAGALSTPFGRNLLGRVGELQDSRSSGSVRTFAPYVEMFPHWIADQSALILGRGAGSSQRLVSQTGIHGLLNPTLMKIFFDYGLVAGTVLFIFVWSLYTRSADPTLAVAIAVSMWTLQTANVPFVVCVLCTVTLWAPNFSARESREFKRTIEPARRAPTLSTT